MKGKIICVNHIGMQLTAGNQNLCQPHAEVLR